LVGYAIVTPIDVGEHPGVLVSSPPQHASAETVLRVQHLLDLLMGLDTAIDRELQVREIMFEFVHCDGQH
jgi:hypothetical protein